MNMNMKMKLAMYSEHKGFFTRIAAVVTHDICGNAHASFDARGTYDPFNREIMKFDDEESLENMVDTVLAAVGLPADKKNTKSDPFADFVVIAVPVPVNGPGDGSAEN